MCVAVAVVAGIAAAGTITAAKMQSNAAKDAAATQTAAGNKALAAQQTAYQTQRQDFSPYQQAGVSSLGRLNQQAQQPGPQFNPNGPPASLGNPMGGQMPPNPGQQHPGGRMAPQGMPQQGPPPSMAPGPSQQQQLGQQQAPPTGKMVLLRAPDGSTRPFPEASVPQVMAAAQAKGHQLQVVG